MDPGPDVLAPAVSPRAGRAGRLAKWVEFIALFAVLPGVLAAGSVKALWLMLFGGAAVCLTLLLTDPTFDRRQLWNARAVPGRIGRVLGLWSLGVLVLGAIVLIFQPGWFLAFPRERPALWAAVMLLYPMLSVFPQTIVFRTFIMHRYRTIFPSDGAMLWASALAFAWGHIIFRNEVALTLTLAGGLIFSYTYQQSRSTLLSAIEHALYGCAVFTLGLGRPLYMGAN
ncbi:MAG: CPBP family intramembrane glutamic endopeptidase [Planctomycetota bacterium]|nr:CPBP family intramembrane glutamic endopeptidase [Planctomycetota bacterium]